jgi:hypothetical protein
MPAAPGEMLAIEAAGAVEVLTFGDLVEMTALLPQDVNIKVRAITEHVASKCDLVFIFDLLSYLSLTHPLATTEARFNSITIEASQYRDSVPLFIWLFRVVLGVLFPTRCLAILSQLHGFLSYSGSL